MVALINLCLYLYAYFRLDLLTLFPGFNSSALNLNDSGPKDCRGKNDDLLMLHATANGENIKQDNKAPWKKKIAIASIKCNQITLEVVINEPI
jgi:hypothetical protein